MYISKDMVSNRSVIVAREEVGGSTPSPLSLVQPLPVYCPTPSYHVQNANYPGHSIGDDRGGQRGTYPPPPHKKSAKIFFGHRVNFGHLSGKYHVKFGHLVNFYTYIFGQKCFAFPKMSPYAYMPPPSCISPIS